MNELEPFPTLAKLAADRWQALAKGRSSPNEVALCRAFALSDFFFHTCQQSPNFYAKILEKIPTCPEIDIFTQRLDDIFEQQLSTIDNGEHFMQSLRRLRHEQMALLCLWQATGQASPLQILDYLSAVATSLLRNTRNWLYRHACQAMGTPTDEQGNALTLDILLMGKLGGGELNFSSDVDLIFCYPEQGETQGRRHVSHHVFFTRLAQKLIQVLDDVTAQGFVYRVDMRLRPFGDTGALVQSHAAMEQYYQDHGRDWERYALIKARPIDAQTEPLLHTLRPFIYRRYLDFSVITSLREMKGKIAHEAARASQENNLKLGIGGIREIEFIVQALQLLHGGRSPSLRTPSLLTALENLATLNLLPRTAADQLRESYIFLRHIENVLQAMQDRQTHCLPTDALSQQRLLLSCATLPFLNEKPQNWADFLQLLHGYQQQVNAQFHQLIGETTTSELTVNPNPYANCWADDFTFSAFSSDKNQQLSQALQGFKQRIARRPLGDRGWASLQALLPLVLQNSAEYSSVTVLRLLNVLDSIMRRTSYLVLLLENPPARQQLVELCAHSAFIAEHVARHPIVLDDLLNRHALLNPPDFQTYPARWQRFSQRADDEESTLLALRQFKQSAFMQIAAADILGALPVMKVSDHLTYLAQTLLDAVLHLAWHQLTARYGKPTGVNQPSDGFLIIAYGKLGGIELGYQSDLDVVFLFDESKQGHTQGGVRSIENSRFFAKLTQKIISIFRMQTAAGSLYDVDIRLRPDGDAGLVCCSWKAFAQYQTQQAWTWENQALVRARAVSGDSHLQEKFAHLRQQILTTPRNREQLRQAVSEMRHKMWQQAPTAPNATQSFHLKHSQGGITDIEFIAQYVVLAYAHDYPELATWSDNVRIFETIAQTALPLPFTAEQWLNLRNAYTTLRNRIHRQNLLGESLWLAPASFSDTIQCVQHFWQTLLEQN